MAPLEPNFGLIPKKKQKTVVIYMNFFILTYVQKFFGETRDRKVRYVTYDYYVSNDLTTRTSHYT